MAVRQGNRGLQTGTLTPHTPASEPRSPGCRTAPHDRWSPCPPLAACWHICWQRSLQLDTCWTEIKIRGGRGLCTLPAINRQKLFSGTVLSTGIRCGSMRRKIQLNFILADVNADGVSVESKMKGYGRIWCQTLDGFSHFDCILNVGREERSSCWRFGGLNRRLLPLNKHSKHRANSKSSEYLVTLGRLKGRKIQERYI